MTHEAGIEAAFNVFDRSGFFPHDSEIEEAIQAYLSASGMVLVPKEPTEAMARAGEKVTITIWEDDMDYNQEIGLYAAEDCFEKMVAAAPDPFKSKP